jgi:hypothetical protein
MPRPLYPQWKSPSFPLDRRLGGLQTRSESGGEEKNSQSPLGIEPPIIQLVTQRYTTGLFRLYEEALGEYKLSFTLRPLFPGQMGKGIIRICQDWNPGCPIRGHSLSCRVIGGTHLSNLQA